jgi:hypothetical protein
MAAVGVGALLAAASVVPATAAQAASSTTVHGTVQSGAAKLAGVPVGFWSRTGTRLASTTTGAGGAFTLRVPSGIRGFAYAGTRPDASHAIFRVSGKAYVRGVIGATQGSTSYPLYQGHSSATAAGLSGGATLRFRLQKPGRIRVSGGSYFHGAPGARGILEVLRLNGDSIQTTVAGATTGTATSRLLVPGSYRVRLAPQLPYLPRTVAVTVPAGSTKTLSPTFLKGAAVSGKLTGPGGAPAVGVLVSARTGAFHWGTELFFTWASDVTDANGRYSLRAAFATGKHDLRVGYAVPRGPDDGDLPPVIPPPTDDNYLPRTVSFTVDAARHAVTQNVRLQKAGHVTGTVAGPTVVLDEQESDVWLETANHRVVRTGVVQKDGTYRLGGLRPGVAYTVYVLHGRYGAASFTATAGTLTRNIVPDRKALTLSGSAGPAATGAEVLVTTSGGVLFELRRYSREIGSTGRYTVQGLIPGVYDVQVLFPGGSDRLTSRTTTVTLLASTTKTLAVGPIQGKYRARFVSGSAPIPHIDVTARNGAGDIAGIAPLRPNTAGRVEAQGLWAGTYRYLPSSFAYNLSDSNVPAVDGPWWFGALSSTFTIAAGRTTDDGTIALHVRARR